MIDLPGPANILVIGTVVGVHIDDSVIVDGMVDVTRYQPLRVSATATIPPWTMCFRSTDRNHNPAKQMK